jgi:hypothetical protein
VPDDDTGPLLLGPLLRYSGARSATVWVQTRDAATATVSAHGRSWSARTFGVHGHHYALVVLDGLEPGSSSDYTVDVDGERVWPPPAGDGAQFPPSRVTTIDPYEPTRLAFGSCRTSVSHDAAGNASNGVDALRAYALELARTDPDRWPHLVCFLGDQVYADETSDEMRAFIRARRDPSQPPWLELKDYEEYAHLYWLAWTDPANRWLLSTLPSAMIFDDHDIRDDWNTSLDWHREMNAKPWWHQRIVGGLASYWVYQHVGNLSPEELADDEIWQRVAAHAESGEEGEVDLTEVLEAFAERVDRHPDSYRWSYARELGDSRLVVVDSRAARVLEPSRRSILDDAEMAWLDEQLHGEEEHLFIGTSLPFLISPGLHDFEAINEAMSSGAWGRWLAEHGESVRRAIDLEHWAAFQEGFQAVMEMVASVARGERGRPPGTITFLSGDVHHSFVTQVDPEALGPGASRVVQLVCSPIRNPMPRGIRVMTALMARGLVRPMRFLAGRSAKVPDPPYPWRVTHGPWYDNCLATLHVRGRGLLVTWEAGEISGDRHHEPRLRTVARVAVS